jgi:hypothetical protein
VRLAGLDAFNVAKPFRVFPDAPAKFDQYASTLGGTHIAPGRVRGLGCANGLGNLGRTARCDLRRQFAAAGIELVDVNSIRRVDALAADIADDRFHGCFLP